MHYTSGEIQKIIKGTGLPGACSCDFHVERIITDSRTVFTYENALFFALKGNSQNGHSFIGELIEKGIHVFVVSEPVSIPSEAELCLIKVDDTLKALQRLAAFHRSRFNYPVIGITGSNGKTIIKEWLNELLSDQFMIVKSPRSYNSQIGVPLSVWLMDEQHNLGIFEAGISKPGEMKNLGEIIQPEIGIFTNLGDAHQENFASIRQKAEEKLLLFRKSKKLIFSSDHDIHPIISDFCDRHAIQKIDWSLDGHPAMIRFSTEIKDGKTMVTAETGFIQKKFNLSFTDRASVENACHCFAATFALETVSDKILPKFTGLGSLAMRLEIRRGINGSLLINDYYNSDINSIETALHVLRQQSNAEQRTSVVILSDIRQSGFPNHELYARVNQLLENSGVDRLIGIGPAIRSEKNQFSQQKQFFSSTDEFIRNFSPGMFRNAAILLKGARDFLFERIATLLEEKAHQTVLEISMNALTDNLNSFRQLISPTTRIMVMVKAFSYGSGDVEVARLLQYQRVDYLAVAVADEGVQLRKAGITSKIVVMNPEKHSFQNLIDFQLEPNIYSLELSDEFSRALSDNGITGYPVHLKMDTGMNRLGFKTSEQVREIGQKVQRSPVMKIQSVFSHLAASDDPAFDSFTRSQIDLFNDFCQLLGKLIGYPFLRHILNSAGVERFPEYRFEMVRLGIGLYGVSSTGRQLKNISTLKSCISQIKEVSPDETVGYSRSGKVSNPSVIAVIPVGYSDGLDRRLGNSAGRVFVNGKYAPYSGNICMDMCMIDVTGIDAKPGDEVELFGNHVTVSEIAGICNTIPYEILTGISQRVKRTYLQE